MHLVDSEPRRIPDHPLLVVDLIGPTTEDGPCHGHAPTTRFALDLDLAVDAQLRVCPVRWAPWLGKGEPLRHRAFDVKGVGATFGSDPHFATPVTLFALDGATVVVPEETHSDGCVARNRVDEDCVTSIIAECEVGCPPVDSGLDPFGVSGEVVGVGPVVDVLVATPEHGVVEGGCELADTTADGVLELAGHNGPCRHESVLLGSLAHKSVDGEGLSGEDNRPIHDRRDPLDIGDAVLTTRVIGGELGNEVVDLETLQILGGDLWVGALDDGQLTPSRRGEAGDGESLRGYFLIDPGSL